MMNCPNCGAPIEENVKFCPNCGGQVFQPQATQPVEPVQPVQPVQPPQAPQPPQMNYDQAPYNQAPVYGQSYQPPVPDYPNGGLIAWSVITLLLCTIPGIVALVQTLGINKCFTVEEQQKKISAAKTWCIVGTVLGVLAIIGSVAARNM